MRTWLWVLLVVGCLPSAGLADVTLNDFAYGIRMDIPAGTAVAATSLPRQVYESATRRDMGDMRVFNAAGEPVPHMIRFAQSRPADPPWRTLAFFPLVEASAEGSGGYRIHVRTGPDGAIVSVDPQLSPSPLDAVRTYLIDLSPLRRSLAQLRLSWAPTGADLMAALRVDASDDLTTWTTLQSRAVVSDMRYAGHRLLRNTIRLASSTRQYLRLRQVDSGPAIRLHRIEGRIQPPGRQPVRAVMTLEGQPVPDSTGCFEYRSSGAFPVDRVNLVFDQANSMAQALLESRSDPTHAWQRRTSGLFYRIDMADSRLTSDPQTVTATMDRYWRLTVDASDSTIGQVTPRLEIGYRPHDLFFIARGSGPFTLAYGGAGVEPLAVNVAALFDGIGRQRGNDLEHWLTPDREQMVLGGPQRLSPPPKPLPMRRIILWSVLLAGVLVVAAMAWRLARRLTG